MKKIVRLTESELTRIVNKVITENDDNTSKFISDIRQVLTQKVASTTVGEKDWEHKTVKKTLPQLIKDIESVIRDYK
jgi:Glu-tRNA(Gln) amidotransferase subunit E-like FAD-binding protein